MSTNRGPSGLAVLAAIDRAERHNPINPGAPVWEILEHLDIPRRTRRARQVRARLDELIEEGLLDHFRRRSIQVWELTDRGREHLTRADARGRVPVLPESPQHKNWRHARDLAERARIPSRFALGDALVDAFLLLDMKPAPHSDVWFGLAERLHAGARQLGSVTHCLHEWAEPSDDRPDLDHLDDPGDRELTESELTARLSWRHGRRNVSLWQAQDPVGR